MKDLTASKLYFLALMTLSYIVGELTHFLIGTNSREVAREIEFGDKACFTNTSKIAKSTTAELQEDLFECKESKNETHCISESHCFWTYSGLGIDYQVRTVNYA